MGHTLVQEVNYTKPLPKKAKEVSGASQTFVLVTQELWSGPSMATGNKPGRRGLGCVRALGILLMSHNGFDCIVIIAGQLISL